MPTPELHTLYIIMGMAGAVTAVSAIGLAMLEPEDSTANEETTKRGRFPVAKPRTIKPTPKEQRCYGSARRLVEIQREWKLAHASKPVLPAAPMSTAADDGFVHWFENSVEIPENRSEANVIAFEDMDNSYVAYCRNQNIPELSSEDFIKILASYSTSQGCKFDSNTGELTHGRLKG